MVTDLMKMAEAFSEMSVGVLSKHIEETISPASANEELTRLLSLQRSVSKSLKTWEEIKGETANALYKAAFVCYANEEELQTNVDPIRAPWDLSQTEEGEYWVRAWVFVPRSEFEEQISRIRETNKAPF